MLEPGHQSAAASRFDVTWLMLLTDTQHAPACATTLIVSLGVLSGFADTMLILAAVMAMFLTHRLVLHARK